MARKKIDPRLRPIVPKEFRAETPREQLLFKEIARLRELLDESQAMSKARQLRLQSWKAEALSYMNTPGAPKMRMMRITGKIRKVIPASSLGKHDALVGVDDAAVGTTAGSEE